MRLMKTRRNTVLFIGAFLLLLIVAGALTAKNNLLLTEHDARELGLVGQKQLVDPGELRMMHSGPGGFWAAHQKDNELVFSYTGPEGHKQWLQSYISNETQLDNNGSYSAIAYDKKVDIVDKQGLVVNQWEAPATVSRVFVSSSGQALVSYATEIADVSSGSWTNNIFLLASQGEPTLVAEHINEEIIDAAWAQEQVAILSYRVSEEYQGHILYIYDLDGILLFSDEVTADAITSFAFNDQGTHLVYATTDKVVLLDINQQETVDINQKNVVAVDFMAPDTVISLTSKPGWIGIPPQTEVAAYDTTGKATQKTRYPGKLLTYEYIANDMLVFATEKAIYGQQQLGDAWIVSLEEQVQSLAMDRENDVLYVYTQQGGLLWFK